MRNGRLISWIVNKIIRFYGTWMFNSLDKISVCLVADGSAWETLVGSERALLKSWHSVLRQIWVDLSQRVNALGGQNFEILHPQPFCWPLSLLNKTIIELWHFATPKLLQIAATRVCNTKKWQFPQDFNGLHFKRNLCICVAKPCLVDLATQKKWPKISLQHKISVLCCGKMAVCVATSPNCPKKGISATQRTKIESENFKLENRPKSCVAEKSLFVLRIFVVSTSQTFWCCKLVLQFVLCIPLKFPIERRETRANLKR